jgi:phosphatidate phosphatase
MAGRSGKRVCSATLDFVIFFGLLGIYVSCLLYVPPVSRGFLCSDQSLRQTQVRDTVTWPWMLATTLIAPLLLISCGEFLVSIYDDRKWSTAITSSTCAVSTFLCGALFTGILTTVIKLRSGCLRPNFIQTCQPDWSQINCSDGYVNEYTCTSGASEGRIRDLHMSFPSGHASSAAYTAIYLALYIQRRLVTTVSTLIGPTLQLLLVTMATFCGLSRVTDGLHHPLDVIVGFCVGTLIAGYTIYWSGYKALLINNADALSHRSTCCIEKAPSLQSDSSEQKILCVDVEGISQSELNK